MAASATNEGLRDALFVYDPTEHRIHHASLDLGVCYTFTNAHVEPWCIGSIVKMKLGALLRHMTRHNPRKSDLLR